MTTAMTSDLNTAKRAFNFSAGPGVVPEEVIRRTQEDLWSLFGSGVGVLEHSHRGKEFDRVLEEAIADCRRVGNIPDDYEVLFLQGGATTQCYQVPMAFLAEDATADYFNTGKWAGDSLSEAKRYGNVHVCGTSEGTNFDRIPDDSDVTYSNNPTYVHFTSNNTIMGTEWHRMPPTPPGDAWFVCDASSDIFSRPIDVKKYGVIYAGAQKNLGPSGVTLVIMRKDIAERCERTLPSMGMYKTHAENDSRYNTPPVFGVYVMGVVFDWILENGGLEGMGVRNAAKASAIYDAIDEGFYKAHAKTGSRSMMNITFNCPSDELNKKFLKEAEANSFDGLKGHRSVGGIRASIYNAFPPAGCQALAQFMRDFAQRNG